MDFIDLFVNIGITLTTGYCVVMGYIQVTEWIRKNWRD